MQSLQHKPESSMTHITPDQTAAVDDTAAWAVANMPARQSANRADDATIQRCFDNLQAALHPARLTQSQRMAAYAEQQQLLSRAKFLKAEAALMADEQWAEYAQDIYLKDGVRIKRSNQFDAQGCNLAWQIQDPEGFKLHHQLLHLLRYP